MKRFTILLIILIMTLSLFSCSEKKGSNEKPSTYEIAMIVDGPEMKESSFDQDTWHSIKKLADKEEIACKYYCSENSTSNAYLEAIQQAVDGGAKFIVLPGSNFEIAAYTAQSTYTDVSFLLIDGVPHDSSNNYGTSSNTVSMIFAEEEAGYLAGYAAVKEGYTKLGFIGGMETPPVKRYGYGFVQGAAAAAAELETKVEMRYSYAGSFAETAEAEKLATSWYKDGSQVIFACGGAMNNSVIKSAEASKKKVIGSDIDQAAVSDTVITSAEKDLDKAIGDILGDYIKGKFTGGMAFNYAAKNNGIKLEMDNSKLTKFTKEDYEKIYVKLKTGEVELKKDTGVKAVGQLAGDWLTIK